MFTVLIKGKHDPKNADLVKLTLVVYRTGFVRKEKLLLITGLYSEWDKKSRCFNSSSQDNIGKNKLLQRERIRYLNIAEKWEYSGKNWDPIELVRYHNHYISRRPIKDPTVLEVIEGLIETKTNLLRIRNKQEFTGEAAARNLSYVKRALERFTFSQCSRQFHTYRFSDITKEFLTSFHLYEMKRGVKNGNGGGADRKVKLFYHVCREAKRMGVHRVDLSSFESLWNAIRQPRYFSKAVSHSVMMKIENADRSNLTKQQVLYLDLFLFSYYAGGMSGIDICHMERGWIQNEMVIYERIKYPNRARVILTSKAQALIEKYRLESYMDYVFPIFKKRDMSYTSRRDRCSYINKGINETLKKLCINLGIIQRITWSTTRSSFISRMVDEGYPILQICEQTGNSPMTIYKHYYAITDTQDMKRKMDGIF